MPLLWFPNWLQNTRELPVHNVPPVLVAADPCIHAASPRDSPARNGLKSSRFWGFWQ